MRDWNFSTGLATDDLEITALIGSIPLSPIVSLIGRSNERL